MSWRLREENATTTTESTFTRKMLFPRPRAEARDRTTCSNHVDDLMTPREPANALWFCRHDDAALRHFARGLDPATFRSWGFELGPRSHLHSEEWMCFFGPDASFRDLQRLTASHGHVPACPILARREGFPQQRSGGVVALSSIRMICLATDSCEPIRPPLRDALLACPTTRLETQSPKARKAFARQRFHVGDMTVARAGQPRAKAKRVCTRTLVLSCNRSEAPRRMSIRLYLACNGLHRAVPSRLVAEPLVSRMKTAGRVGTRLFEHRAPRPTLLCSPAKGCTFLWTEELSTAGTRRRKGLLPVSWGRPSARRIPRGVLPTKSDRAFFPVWFGPELTASKPTERADRVFANSFLDLAKPPIAAP